MKWFGALVLLVACGDNATPEPEFRGIPHAPHVSSAGGPVLVAPKIVPIFFAGDDDMRVQLEAFLTAIASSSYWTAVTSEYGVGPMTIEPSIVTDDPPPTTDEDLQGMLEAHLEPPVGALSFARPQLRWPAPDANTLYVVFLPADVVLSAGSSVSCKAFGGYHYETTQSHIVYALLPRCMPTAAPIDKITPALSHELVEAATDPHPNSAPAFVVLDHDDIVWAYTPGGELGDMCEYVRAARQRLVGDYLVQRSWSNDSAGAGHDPCVPALPGPYVTAAPLFGDVTFAVAGTPITTRGIQVANGESATIEVALLSDAATPDWTVEVDDVAAVVQGLPAELELSLDQSVGNAGDRFRLEIKRLKNGQGGGSELVIVSQVGGQSVSLWWGLVTN